jgi:deazaflavin-dependent oxidoreductase (nitroreductase family)
LEEPRAVGELIHVADGTVKKPAFGSWQWRAGNAIVTLAARGGIGPIHLLTTRDRRTGEPHTTPVVPVEHDGRRWLVAPYGVVGWVRNVRADGRVRLRYGRTTREYSVREVEADEAGPVLKRYVAVATKTRTQFQATKDSPVKDFVAEAGRHPVFELIPAPDDPPTGRGSSAESTPPASDQDLFG